MKKIFFFILFSGLIYPIFGQFRDPLNVSLFTGTSVAQQNVNNQAYWYGLYLDHMFVRTRNEFDIGLAATASQSSFKSNDATSLYNGQSASLGGGLALSKHVYYLGPKHDGYFGATSLLRRDQDIGEGRSVTNGALGVYTMTQTDLLLSGELNLNLLKRVKSLEDTSDYNPNLLPRTQLRLVVQESLQSDKSSFWNNNPINESLVWSKAAYLGELRQSIYQFGNRVLLEPKLIAGYHYYRGNESHWLLGGAELGIKNLEMDNFLSLYFLVKQQMGNYQENLNSRQFIIGLNFSPSNLIRKK